MLRHVRSLYYRDAEYISIITLLFIRESFLRLMAYIFRRHREIFIILPSADESPITCGMHRVAHRYFPFFFIFLIGRYSW